MPRSVGETQLKNTTLEVMLLPRGSRTVTEAVITAGAAANAGDTTLSLSGDAAGRQIRSGTSLSFGPVTMSNGSRRKQALIIDDATLGTTPSNINCAPLIDNITNGDTAKFVLGLVPVFGVQEFSFAASDQTVDTTDTQSGAGTESAVIRSGLEFTINCIERISDYGLTGIIKQVGLNFGLKGREVYAVLTYPDGEIHRGAAKVMNYSQPGNQNEVKRGNFTLQFQGESYRYIPAYGFDGTFPTGGGAAPSYDSTITIVTTNTPITTNGVTFTSAAGNILRFVNKTTGTSTPVSMSLFVGATNVGQVDFTDRYLGERFSVTIGGTVYASASNTFRSGNITLAA